MSVELSIILSLFFYKLMSLFTGLMCVYMGYKLFTAGIWGKAGDITTAFNDNKIVLKNAAPGTVFAVFGAVIIMVTIAKGLEFEKYKTIDEADMRPKIELPDIPPSLNKGDGK